MSIHTTVASPLGDLLLVGRPDPAAPGGVALLSLSFADRATTAGRSGATAGRRDPAAFAGMERQLLEYFAGARTTFEIDHVPAGTPFQRRVWAAVAAVPFGDTTTYGEVAATVGAPRDRIRAVAAAVGANPLLIVRPCHRVVGSNGALTGYAGGLARKQALLTLEGAVQPTLFDAVPA